MKAVSKMVCRECAEKRHILFMAWERADVATAIDDPIPCCFCGRGYERGDSDKTYPIMDCLIPESLLPYMGWKPT